jgi:putative peptide zinc metalloprotease protein
VMLLMVLAFPRVAGTAWISAQRELAAANAAWSAGDHLDALGSYLAIVAVLFPVLASILVLLRFGRRAVTGAWRGTAGRPIRRAGAGLLIAAMVAGLAWAWWPSAPRYRPIQPWEEGTLTQAVAAVAPGSSAAARPAVSGAFDSDSGELGTAWPEDKPLPTPEQPQLALVLVPHGAPGTDSGADGAAPGSPPATDPGTDSPTWVFPFDQPDPPEPGGNQALAVNTTDNSVVYDVALAMVWADGQEDVDNVNSANAFASCTDCVTVAISFQVVLVVGQADVVIPQNIAQAVNWDCFRCITAALASQLVITLDDAPGEAELVALSDIWSDLAQFATTIYGQPISAIQAQLEEFKAEILEILGEAPPAADPATGTEQPGTDPSPAPTDGSTAGSAESTTSPDQSGTSEDPDPAEPSSSSAPPEPAPSPTAEEPTPAEATQPTP